MPVVDEVEEVEEVRLSPVVVDVDVDEPLVSSLPEVDEVAL